MTHKRNILTALLASAAMFAANGCALLTAKTVGTAVATHVGKKVVKDAVTKDDDEKKAEEGKQTAEAPK